MVRMVRVVWLRIQSEIQKYSKRNMVLSWYKCYFSYSSPLSIPHRRYDFETCQRRLLETNERTKRKDQFFCLQTINHRILLLLHLVQLCLLCAPTEYLFNRAMTQTPTRYSIEFMLVRNSVAINFRINEMQ